MSKTFKVICLTAAMCLVMPDSFPAWAQSPLDPRWSQSPEDGGVRRWEVTGAPTNLVAEPDSDVDVLGAVPPGSVVSNLGCAMARDRMWCQVQSPEDGLKGYVPVSHLRPATGPDGVVAFGVDDSRARAQRRDFDATGKVACAQERGQTLSSCSAFAARSGGGDTTIVVAFSNGFRRSLYFEFGAFVRASSTMSGVGRDIDWSLDNGDYVIRVDDQRFVVSQAFVLGSG